MAPQRHKDLIKMSHTDKTVHSYPLKTVALYIPTIIVFVVGLMYVYFNLDKFAPILDVGTDDILIMLGPLFHFLLQPDLITRISVEDGVRTPLTTHKRLKQSANLPCSSANTFI